jgi:molybdenum cofactor biosynthesis protein B
MRDATAESGTVEHAGHDRRGHRDGMTASTPAVRFAILTVSDTRTSATDQSGAKAAEVVAAAGLPVVRRGLVRDERGPIGRWVAEAAGERDVDAIVVTGGTGLSPRDVTPEALQPLFESKIPGFGEAFRRLSYDRIGTDGLLSRADAGLVGGKPVFLLPGSPAAVELGVPLALPIAVHVVQLRRSGPL